MGAGLPASLLLPKRAGLSAPLLLPESGATRVPAASASSRSSISEATLWPLCRSCTLGGNPSCGRRSSYDLKDSSDDRSCYRPYRSFPTPGVA
eukprot:1163899-Pyramimonas_sp.AAC.1